MINDDIFYLVDDIFYLVKTDGNYFPVFCILFRRSDEIMETSELCLDTVSNCNNWAGYGCLTTNKFNSQIPNVFPNEDDDYEPLEFHFNDIKDYWVPMEDITDFVRLNKEALYALEIIYQEILSLD